MKSLIVIFSLVLLVSCGKGGSNGSSSPVSSNEVPRFLDRLDSTYTLKVDGCNGSTFTAIVFTNPGTVYEDRIDWNGNIDASGTTNISSIVGKAIEWEVTSVSGGCQLDMELTRNTDGAIYVATEVIPLNGQTGFIQDY